jgi:hypothetical protein
MSEEIKNENVLAIVPDSEKSLEVAVKSAGRYLELQDTIRKMAINLTNQNDWINQNGNPYLEWTGASKIACAFGVSYSSPVFEKELCKDETGEFVVFHCTAVISWNGRSMPEIGTGSSRDPFFGKSGGRWLPLSEIDLTDIKKKAMTNFLNRGIKSLLGLSYSWDEIENISNKKINRTGGAKIEYSSGSQGSKNETKESKDLRVEIDKMLLDINMGDKVAASENLELLTRWEKDGTKYKGKFNVKDLHEKGVPIIYGRVKKLYEEFQKKIENTEKGEITQ